MGIFKKKIIYKVEIVVEPDGDGFHAWCPALKGLHVDGATEGEATSNAGDAAIAYIQSLIKHNEPIPIGDGLIRGTPVSTGGPSPPAEHFHQLSVAV